MLNRSILKFRNGGNYDDRKIDFKAQKSIRAGNR